MMNEEQGQKGPGRPRVYSKPSEKVEAFRRRLDAAGYLRKEVLVQKKVWLVIQDIAKRKGVSTVDAASGLLEHGLKGYLEPRNELPVPFRQGTLMFTDETASTGVGRAERGETEIPPANQDPILRFLEKRKEISNDDEDC